MNALSFLKLWKLRENIILLVFNIWNVCEIWTLKLKSLNSNLMLRWEWPFAVTKFLHTHIHMSDKPANGVNNIQTELSEQEFELNGNWTINLFILSKTRLHVRIQVWQIKWNENMSKGGNWCFFFTLFPHLCSYNNSIVKLATFKHKTQHIHTVHKSIIKCKR